MRLRAAKSVGIYTLSVIVMSSLCLGATAVRAAAPDDGSPVGMQAVQLPEGSAVVKVERVRRTVVRAGLQPILSDLATAQAKGDRAALATFAGERFVDLAAGKVRVVLEMAADPDARPLSPPTVEKVAVPGGQTAEVYHAPQVAIRRELAAAIAATGAVYETANGSLVQVLAPIGALPALARLPGVRLVRLPFPAEPHALPPLQGVEVMAPLVGTVTSEGVSLTHASTAHGLGYDGTDVKLAVFDFGFSGWKDRRKDGDVPSNPDVVKKDFSAAYTFNPETPGYEHGTACAEAAFDMAPGSTVYLYAFSTEVEFASAVDDYITNETGTRVASMSIGWVNAGPYDGTGIINAKIDQAEAAGIFWANSAGNSSKMHWSGTSAQFETGDFVAFDSGVIEGYGPSSGFAWNVPSGTRVTAFLEWNDWNAGRTGNQNHVDYDIYLYRWTGSSWSNVASSIGNQCSGTVAPTETISYTAPAGGPFNYGLVIQRYTGGGSCPNNFGHWMTLHSFLDAGTENTFWYVNECNSLTIPADGDSAVTVGATFWNEDATSPLYGLEPFSSFGPRNASGGGNPGTAVNKPDVVAPDGVSTATYGASDGTSYADGGTGFFGTSAAAPHVAGLAATLWEAYPSFTLAQLRSYVQNHALYKADGATCGGLAPQSTTQNNRYGWGRIDVNNAAPVLGAIGDKTVDEGTELTFTATATDSDVPADTLTFSLDVGAPSGASIDPTTGVFTWTPTEDQGPGVHPVTVRVTDDGVSPLDDSETIQITVNEVNDPPEFSSTPVLDATEDVLYTYNVTTTDPDAGDTRTITAPTLPSWLTLTDNGDGTATLSGTPTNADAGTSHAVTLQVTDAAGAFAEQSFSITVANTNDDPAFSSTPVLGATEGVLYTYNVTTTDPDMGDTRTITAPTLPAWLTLTDNGNGTATLSGSPGSGDVGDNAVILRVTDAAGAFAEQSFTIAVASAIIAPTFTSAAGTSFTMQAPGTFTLTATGTPAVTSITPTGALPKGVTFTDNHNGTATLAGTPAAGTAGPWAFDLTADNGAQTVQHFTLTVVGATTTTTVSAYPNPSVTGQEVRFSAKVGFTTRLLGAPTGTVTFYVNGVSIGTAPVVGAAAAITHTFTEARTYKIKAVYSGDHNFRSSSGLLTGGQVVNAAP